MASIQSQAEHVIQLLQSIGVKIQWEQLPTAVTDYIVANPGLTAIQLVATIVAICPGLIAAPALLGLGFGGAGPVTGSVAASFQAAHGTPALFSMLQSAAMGGYGAGIVSGVIQGASLIGGAAGSVAAAFQAPHGTAAVSSMPQIAAMKTYGASIVAGVVQSASLFGGTLVGLFNKKQ